MKASEAQKKASLKYERETVESIRFRLPKGKRVLVKKCADANKESVNAMLNRLVDKEIERVLTKKK